MPPEGDALEMYGTLDAFTAQIVYQKAFSPQCQVLRSPSNRFLASTLLISSLSELSLDAKWLIPRS